MRHLKCLLLTTITFSGTLLASLSFAVNVPKLSIDVTNHIVSAEPTVEISTPTQGTITGIKPGKVTPVAFSMGTAEVSGTWVNKEVFTDVTKDIVPIKLKRPNGQSCTVDIVATGKYQGPFEPAIVTVSYQELPTANACGYDNISVNLVNKELDVIFNN